MDPHHFGKLDPDPHPHQSKKVEALESFSVWSNTAQYR
jgi:hypothetical protein